MVLERPRGRRGDGGDGWSCVAAFELRRAAAFRLSSLAPSVDAVAGEGEEDLVERRLLHATARSRWMPASRNVTSRSVTGSGSRIGAVMPCAPRARRPRRRRARVAIARAPRRVSAGSASRSCSDDSPTEALSSSAVPSATTLPRSMTAMRSASWSASSRYCVVSSTVEPVATRRRMVSHICARVRGSRPGGRLVEEDERRLRDEARREVEAAAHAAGELLERTLGGIGQPELLEQLGGLRLRLGAAEAEQAGEEVRGSRWR